MTEPPNHVHGLAEQRAKARAERDFAAADALRQEIEDAGWLVRDAAGGFELTPRPPFKVWPTVASIPVPAPEDGRPAATSEREPAAGRDGEPTATRQGERTAKAEGEATVAPEGEPAATRQGERTATRDGEPAAGRQSEPLGSREGEPPAGGGEPAVRTAVEARHLGTRESGSDDAAETLGVDDDVEAGAEARVGDETGTHAENVLESQVLWDATLATSRLDRAISPAPDAQDDAPAQEHADTRPQADAQGHAGTRRQADAQDHAGTTDRARAASGTVTVALLVDGSPSDLRECVDALIDHTDAKILALDLGNVEGAGVALHELAGRHPERIEAWHVAETPHWRGGPAGWGESRNKLLALDSGDVHVVMETSTVLDGDAIAPLAAALDGDVVAAGWKGVDPDEGGLDWHEAGPGEVRGLLGYLFAVRRDQALAAGGFPEKARYYRNADLEFSLTLPGTLVVPDERLPVHQERHRGYHDVDPDYRDRESRRTYDRVLRLLRSGADR
ncbi:hypothetical protein [Sphaerisporangium dianthi]|uniref:Cysteinyl-tRNA ligase anticodon binding domain-containing protein n=1 Tax=Sphaerisporangium dianthi TaxID=1436120 RepID=A0ABV9CA94_9ACTN